MLSTAGGDGPREDLVAGGDGPREDLVAGGDFYQFNGTPESRATS